MKSKNSFLKMVLLMLIMMFGVISCDFLANKTIRVPNSVIESKAKEKFPITKNFICKDLFLYIHKKYFILYSNLF